MFNAIKSKVNLVEYISKDLELDLKEAGTDTYAIEDEKDYGGCPFCNHNDCFKVKQIDGTDDFSESFFKCFSCGEHGDVIAWVAKRTDISPVDAAKKLAKEFSIPLPNDYNPMQELFTTAAQYYHTCLKDTCNKATVKLSHMTPLEYQERVRKHSIEAINHFQIGWSDGGLIEFLEGLGYNEELLLESGLKNRKHGKDFLPRDCFIYPHFAKGRVSHFTFKDPLKKVAYQLPNKYVLNGAEFYNQDSIKSADTVLIVEGENDVITSWEYSDSTQIAVIGTIGTISGDQLDWIRENLSSKNIVTAFDPDDAGNKYREKLDKIKGSLKSLVQVMPPNEKDIDAALSQGGIDLLEYLNANVMKVPVPLVAPPVLTSPSGKMSGIEGLVVESGSERKADAEEDSMENNSVVEKHGAYYRVKFKDGEPFYTKISNCTLQLLNVYRTKSKETGLPIKKREILVIKDNGIVSDRMYVEDKQKVSLGLMRPLLAMAADADFKGTDHDLSDMWEIVYKKGHESKVQITETVGRNEKVRGWILRNRFVSDTGVVVKPDEDGIFWHAGNRIDGIKPDAINEAELFSDEENRSIPYLEADTTPEEREELLKNFVLNLAKNLGDPGKALLLTAWMNSCAYSNSLFDLNKSFPMLFVWSTHGQGKGSICTWLMGTYGLESIGRTAVSQIRSGVGLSRKASYYASLPLWVDEVRADKETEELQGMFRDYFDRGTRDMGSKDGTSVKSVSVRCCTMFSGEDQFPDQATKERCLVIRLPSQGRETKESFAWFGDNEDTFSSIGFKWILESVNENHSKLKEEVNALDSELKNEAKCSARKAKSWATIGVFALRLAAKYMPDFDMKAYLHAISLEDSSSQKSETTVAQFFESVESIMAREGLKQILNDNHIGREGNKLHIWFAPVYKAVQDEYHGRFSFSRNAVLGALREEKYFLSDRGKYTLGLQGCGTRRDVITLDLDKCPDCIKNIAKVNE